MGLVAIIDASEEYRSQASILLAEQTDLELVLAQDVGAALDIIAAQGPTVLLLGPSLAINDVERLTAAVSLASVPMAVLLVSADCSPEILRAAFKAGVSDVLSASAPAMDVSAAVREAHDRVVATRSAAEPKTESCEEDAKLAHVVTVFSTKGGVGKSVTATNLGVALARRNGSRVAIVDLDLQFGDVGIMLGLTPERTIVDAVQRFDRLDQDMLAGFMTHHGSGLDALLAPTQPEDAEIITTGRIDHIMGLLRRMYDIIVIDTAASLDEVVLAALDRSHEVYAVTMMDVASIKNTRISIQKLCQLGYSENLIRLVLNRADSKVWLQSGEVERAIGHSIHAEVPSDRVVPRSVNKGVPVVVDAPKSDVAKALVSLANGIAGAAEEVKVDVA